MYSKRKLFQKQWELCFRQTYVRKFTAQIVGKLAHIVKNVLTGNKPKRS